MDFQKIKNHLEKNGYTVREFATKEEAGDYILTACEGKSVGIGGSMTVEEMGLYERLAAREGAPVYWHWRKDEAHSGAELCTLAATADIYLSSVNGISENGEIVNIDGTSNRVSALNYGHKKVFFLVGENKIAPDFEGALCRARNVAAPLNAKRLGMPTPCALRGDRCYHCDSPKRICRSLSVLWRAPGGCAYEVILIHEPLGY